MNARCDAPASSFIFLSILFFFFHSLISTSLLVPPSPCLFAVAFVPLRVAPPHPLPLCFSSPRLRHVSRRLRLASHHYLALRHASSLMCHVNIRRNTAASSF